MELKFVCFLFAMLVYLYDGISCDVINVKNFREILRYFFKILATPLHFLTSILTYFVNMGQYGN